MFYKNKLLIILLIFCFSINYSYSQKKVNPKIEVMKLKLEKESDFSIISNLEFELKISGLNNKFINAKEVNAPMLKDEFGNDLIELGKKKYDFKSSQGFYTSRQTGWEFQRYYDDSLKNAFKGIFNCFELPAQGSKYVELTSEINVLVEKPGKIREKIVKNVVIQPDSSITVEGKKIIFKQYGSVAYEDITFFIYKFDTDLAILEISPVDVITKYPEGLSQNPDELLVPGEVKKMDIKVKLTDSEIIKIPIKMKIFLGI